MSSPSCSRSLFFDSVKDCVNFIEVGLDRQLAFDRGEQRHGKCLRFGLKQLCLYSIVRGEKSGELSKLRGVQRVDELLQVSRGPRIAPIVPTPHCSHYLITVVLASAQRGLTYGAQAKVGVNAVCGRFFALRVPARRAVETVIPLELIAAPLSTNGLLISGLSGLL